MGLGQPMDYGSIGPASKKAGPWRTLVGGEVLGLLLVLRDIASVLAVGVVVSHSVLVIEGSGEFWWVVAGPRWVLDGSWCLSFEVSGSFCCFHWFLVEAFFLFKIARYSNEVSG
jgi:hypothetical protein